MCRVHTAVSLKEDGLPLETSRKLAVMLYSAQSFSGVYLRFETFECLFTASSSRPWSFVLFQAYVSRNLFPTVRMHRRVLKSGVRYI